MSLVASGTPVASAHMGPVVDRVLQSTASRPTSTTNNETAIPDEGDFKVVYTTLRSRQLLPYRMLLTRSHVLTDLADELNQILALPTDLPIEVVECDEPNAFYDPEFQVITVCYELVDGFYSIFAEGACHNCSR